MKNLLKGKRMAKKQEKTRALLKFASNKPNLKIMVEPPKETIKPDGSITRRAAWYARFKNHMYDPSWNDGLYGGDPYKKEARLIEIINNTPEVKREVKIIDEVAEKNKAEKERKKQIVESPEYQNLLDRTKKLEEMVMGKAEEKAEEKPEEEKKEEKPVEKSKKK